MNFEERVAERRRIFKKGIDSDDARRNRADEAVSLRKYDYEEQLSKKRQQAVEGGSTSSGAVISNTPPAFEPKSAISQLNHYVWTVRNTKDMNELFQSVQNIRKFLSMDQFPMIGDVVDSGIVPDLIELLKKESEPTIQFEAAWALTNIASGTQEQTKVVVNAGAVPIFVSLLSVSGPDNSVREQAVWAIGNIAGDSPTLRDYVLQCGAMEPLLRLVQTEGGSITLQRNVTWTLSNFCRGNPPPKVEDVAMCLPTICGLINHKDDDTEVLTDACWAFSYFCGDCDHYRVTLMLDTGVLNRMVQLLNHSSVSVIQPALRVVGNVVSGPDEHTQAGLSAGCLEPLKRLLEHHKKNIRKEAAWTVSNIVAGNHEQIQAVLDANMIKPMIKLSSSGTDWDTRKETCWALTNSISGSSDRQKDEIINMGCMKPLVEVCTISPDPLMQKNCLTAIKNILEFGAKHPLENGDNRYLEMLEEVGGFDMLEKLQENASDEVYEMAVQAFEFIPQDEMATLGIDNNNDTNNMGLTQPNHAIPATSLFNF